MNRRVGEKKIQQKKKQTTNKPDSEYSVLINTSSVRKKNHPGFLKAATKPNARCSAFPPRCTNLTHGRLSPVSFLLTNALSGFAAIQKNKSSDPPLPYPCGISQLPVPFLFDYSAF